MAINIQLRRGTAEEWSTVNPVLALAEMCIETDTDLFKIGNGIDVWNDLPYGGLRGYVGSAGFTGSIGSMIVDNVVYVSKSGDDLNDGLALNTSKLTIKAAVEIATYGTTIFVKSGDYTEDNPILVPEGISIVGDNLRTVTVRPANVTQDLFWVNNRCYLEQMTFKDHEAPAAAVAFPTDGSAGVIHTSPYVQNCTSMTTTGTGMRVDGDHVLGLKSMVVDAFTQYNQGGIGIHMLNRGNTQLVSVFTICCDIAFLCETGGFCSITNANSSFGNYGLKALGVSSLLYTGTAAAAPATSSEIVVSGLAHTPYLNNVVTFDDGATYYSIDGATTISSGSSTVTLDQRLETAITAGTTAKFYQASRIMASNHTFEYCGSGTDLIYARPQFGGIPNQLNEIIQENGGQVFFTSTDQKGDFRIGTDLKIDRGSGTIEGVAFERSLFAVMTPYILALEG
jgi:hypothetical protein